MQELEVKVLNKWEISGRICVRSVDGAAKAGSDYVAVNEVILFGDEETHHTVTVKLLDDSEWE